MAAPVGEVTTPMCRGRVGTGFFRAVSNSPSACSFRFNSSKACCRAPSPAGSRCSTTIWKSPRFSYSVTLPRIRTWSPSRGGEESRWLNPRNIAHRTWHFESFSEKYQCPDEGRENPDSSPSTQTCMKLVSSRCRAWWFSSLTVSARDGRIGSGEPAGAWNGEGKVVSVVGLYALAEKYGAKRLLIQTDAIGGLERRGLLSRGAPL